MAKARSKKNNVPMLLFAAAGAGALYFFTKKPNQKEEAIKIIIASGIIKDPVVLAKMDENYLVAWAYAITNKLPAFPGIAPKNLTDNPIVMTFSRFITQGGKRAQFALLDDSKMGQRQAMLKLFTDPTQKAFATALLNATGTKMS